MEEVEISRTVSNLSSNRLKDRNDALEELTSILKQRSNAIPSKLLSQTSQTLIELLDSEYRKYNDALLSTEEFTQSKLTLMENKFSSVAYVLRLLIEKTCSRFKLKTFKMLLVIIPELMVKENSKVLLEPISVHLSFSLLALLNSNLFQQKFTLHQWITLAENVCNYLEERFSSSVSDRNVSNLLSILNCLLSMNSFGLKYMSTKIHDVVLKYLKLCKRQTANTRQIVIVLNHLILKTHCDNILKVRILIREMWRHLIGFDVATNDQLHDDLCLFDIYSSELIRGELPEMVGREEAEADYFETESALPLCLEYIVSRVTVFRSSSLSVDQLTFVEQNDIRNWFELKHFRLKQCEDPSGWLRLFCVSKLLLSYFELKSLHSQEQHILKRRKFESNIATILRLTGSMNDFLINCLSSVGIDQQPFVLSLVAFHADCIDIDKNNVEIMKELISQKFQSPELIPLASLALIPLISQKNLNFSKEDAGQLIMLSIPLLKRQDLCQVLCALLVTAMKYSPQVISDQTILNQIYSLYELSHLIGPGLICNEAFIFWKYLHRYGRELKLQGESSAADKVLEWLKSKWSQILIIKEEQSEFYYFLSWLANRGNTLAYIRNNDLALLYTKGSSLKMYDFQYTHWKSCSEQRNFLLQTDSKMKSYKQSTDNSVGLHTKANKISLNEIFYRMLASIEPDSSLSISEKLKWMIQISRLLVQLKGDSSYLDLVLDFKRTASAFMNETRFKDIGTFEFFLRVMQFEFNETGCIQIHDINVDHLMQYYDELFCQNLGRKHDEDPRLEEVFGMEGMDNKNLTRTFNEQQDQCQLRLAVRAFVNILEFNIKEESNITLQKVLTFLDGVRCNDITNGLSVVVEWMITQDCSWNSSALEYLVQLLNEHILQTPYNTSETGILILCRFLDATRNAWLDETKNSLNTDSNDILEWILMRFEDSSCSSISALQSLTQLLLHMLWFHDLSKCVKGGKQKVFSTFSKCLNKCEKSFIINQLPEISGYMRTLSHKNQDILFSELKMVVDVPQEGLEMSAFYSLVMYKLSLVSYSTLVASLKDAMNHAQYRHTRVYISSYLHKLAADFRLGSTRRIFDICGVDIIQFWVTSRSAETIPLEQQWDVSLFEFKSLSDFIEEYQIELSASHFSKEQGSSSLLEKIKAITKKSEQKLLEESFHLAFPLSFMTKGIGKNIFVLFKQLPFELLLKPESRFLVLKWVLFFLDLGSTLEMATVIPKFYGSSSYVTDLFISHSAKARYQFPSSISLVEGITLIKKYLCEKPFNGGEAQYVMMWILSEMKDTRYPEERQKCVRQFKYALLLFQDISFQATFYFDVLSELSKYIIDPNLHDEVTDIVVCLLRMGYVNSLLKADTLSTVFSSIFVYMRTHQKAASRVFTNMADEIRGWNLQHSKIWGYCNDLIQGRGVCNDVYNCDDFISGAINGTSRMHLLSVLFSHASKFKLSYLENKPSLNSIHNLFKFEIPSGQLSDNFQLWRAYHLSSFENVEFFNLDNKPLRYNPRIDYACLFDDFGKFEAFFDLFFNIYESSDTDLSIDSKQLCMSLISLAMHGKEIGNDNFCDIPLHYKEKYEQWCAPMTYETFIKVHQLSKKLYDMDEFVRVEFLEINSTYSSWLVKLSISLVNHISLGFPQFMAFSILFEKSQLFCERMLPILFNLIMYYDHKKGIEWSTNIFSRINTLASTNEFKKKMSSAIDIISMLRTGYICNERFCSTAYCGLSLDLVCESALVSDQIDFAYMLFEESTMNSLDPFDSNLLSKIYDSIGDADLISGLPISQDVFGALKYINKTEPKSWKAFLFNNAKLDADFNSSSVPVLDSVLKCAEYHGFYGLSSTLGKHTTSSETSTSYRWALELDNWNLPVADHIDTREKGLYSTLKQILVQEESPLEAIEQTMVTVLRGQKCFSSDQEWLKTLSELSTLSKYVECLRSMEHAEKVIKEIHKRDRKQLKFVGFEDHKIILQSRYLLLKLLSNSNLANRSLEPFEIQVLTGVELANFINLAVDNKSGQDGLHKSMVLDRLNRDLQRQIPSQTIKSNMDILQKTVSARALWEYKDFKTPIAMMKDLLQDKLIKNNYNERVPLVSLTNVSTEEIVSLLIQWTSESRLETASSIFEKYIENFSTNTNNPEVLARIFYVLATFLEAQLRKMRDDGAIEEWQKRCDRGFKESQALEAIYKNTKLPKSERKDAERHLSKVRVQLHSDMETLSTLTTQKLEFVRKSLHFYMQTLKNTNTYDNDVRDRFCGLWFEYDKDDSINSLLRRDIGSVPSWKFLPWVNQIASKLTSDDTEFQKALQFTMKRLLYKLPYDSLYSIMSIKLYAKNPHGAPSSIAQRIKAVEKILQDLESYDKGRYYSQYVIPVEEFCNMSVELATMKLQSTMKESKKINLSDIENCKYWLKQLIHEKLPLPTMRITINSSGDKKIIRPYIIGVKDTVEVSSTGLSLPKIITFRISDGSIKKVLMKGSNDDLRQDAIMEQVFRQVNNILKGDKEMRKFGLNMETYEVIPLGPRAGIIEFVPNSISLNTILLEVHKNDPITASEARIQMKRVQNKSNTERMAIYLELTKKIHPKLRNFFFTTFSDPSEWLKAKRSYTKGTAVASIVGYVLGLGDRHLNNILIDYRSGKPIHIDLGIAFDQGRFLSIPELVPFRLTRDIVDGFGVTGVEGLFRRSCERSYCVLQKNYDRVMHVLNILKWDPLYSWLMSPIKKHKHLLDDESDLSNKMELKFDMADALNNSKEEENEGSYRALKGVEEKLIKNGLSVEATVQELIQQASDPRNLSIIFMGWSPFY